MRTISEFDTGFMGQILALRKAPAIIRSDRLMPIWAPSTEIVLPIVEMEVAPPKPIQIVPATWLETLVRSGVRMAGPSRGDIESGRCIPYKDKDGVVVMGYRFPT